MLRPGRLDADPFSDCFSANGDFLLPSRTPPKLAHFGCPWQRPVCSLPHVPHAALLVHCQITSMVIVAACSGRVTLDESILAYHRPGVEGGDLRHSRPDIDFFWWLWKVKGKNKSSILTPSLHWSDLLRFKVFRDHVFFLVPNGRAFYDAFSSQSKVLDHLDFSLFVTYHFLWKGRHIC